MFGHYSRCLACILLVLTGPSCGLFSIRDAEYPDPEITDQDPINLSALLDGTGQEFEELGFEDVFSPGFSYDQGTGTVYSRGRFVDRLRTIVETYGNIGVRWTRSGPTPSLTRTDTLSVGAMRYDVYLEGTDGGEPDYTGSVDILVYFDRTWRIHYWRDFPVTHRDGVSFFSPEFVQ